MNSAIRDVIFVNDMTLFRAWMLALFVAIIGSNLMESMGWLGEWGLTRQAFAPIAAITGGYIFGLGIVMAGGCGTGILYKQGEGQLSAMISVFGFAAGLLATMHGPLRPVSKFLKSYKVTMGQGDNKIYSLALWDLFGGPKMKWITIAIVCAIMFFVFMKGKPFASKPKKGWSWSLGGLMVGITVILAWWASYYFGQQARGISAAGPTSEAVLMVTMGNSMSNYPMFDFWGISKGSWSALYVLGIPLGAFISAKALGEFKLSIPKDPMEILRVLFGGVVMGFGAAVAGG